MKRSNQLWLCLFSLLTIDLVFSQTIDVPPPPLPTATPVPLGPITTAEFFINIDPGEGNGKPMQSVGTVAQTAFDTTTLPSGVHLLFVRFQDSQGVWSRPKSHAFYVPSRISPLQHSWAVTGEYFFNDDPGEGFGNLFIVESNEIVTSPQLESDISSLLPGFHTLYFRFKSEGWGPTESTRIYIPETLEFEAVAQPVEFELPNIRLVEDVVQPNPDEGWTIVGTGDFDGDADADLLWRREDKTGEPHIHIIQNGALIEDVALPTPDPGWEIVGVGDFDRDGDDDLVWHRIDRSGEPRIHIIETAELLFDVSLPVPNPGWEIVGVGDFDGDADADLIWRLIDRTGEPRIHIIENLELIKDVGLPVPDPGWEIVGIGDFDKDGDDDLLWRRENRTLEPRIHILEDLTLLADISHPIPDPGWKIEGVGDFDNDGDHDIVWRRVDDSLEARIHTVENGNLVYDIGLPQADLGWDIVGTGDFDNDGDDDLVWRRAAENLEARIWLLGDELAVPEPTNTPVPIVPTATPIPPTSTPTPTPVIPTPSPTPVVVLPTVTPLPPVSFRPGDLNRDGKRESGDINLMVNLIFDFIFNNEIEADDFDSADIHPRDVGDGVIDAQDYVLLIDLAFEDLFE